MRSVRCAVSQRCCIVRQIIDWIDMKKREWRCKAKLQSVEVRFDKESGSEPKVEIPYV